MQEASEDPRRPEVSGSSEVLREASTQGPTWASAAADAPPDADLGTARRLAEELSFIIIIITITWFTKAPARCFRGRFMTWCFVRTSEGPSLFFTRKGRKRLWCPLSRGRLSHITFSRAVWKTVGTSPVYDLRLLLPSVPHHWLLQTRKLCRTFEPHPGASAVFGPECFHLFNLRGFCTIQHLKSFPSIVSALTSIQVNITIL